MPTFLVKKPMKRRIKIIRNSFPLFEPQKKKPLAEIPSREFELLSSRRGSDCSSSKASCKLPGRVPSRPLVLNVKPTVTRKLLRESASAYEFHSNSIGIPEMPTERLDTLAEIGIDS